MIFILFIFVFNIYISQKCILSEGLTNKETTSSKNKNNIINFNLLSPLEKLKILQKNSIANKKGKQKQLNFNYNKLIDTRGYQKEIYELENNQVDLDDQLKELNKQKNDITSKHADRLARQLFGSSSDAVASSKPVSNSMRKHLNSMNQDEPFAKNNGKPGSHGNNDLEKCLAGDSCQTKPFYKGNFIPTGNSLYGSCPCPETHPHVFGAHWSCCPVPTTQ